MGLVRPGEPMSASYNWRNDEELDDIISVFEANRTPESKASAARARKALREAPAKVRALLGKRREHVREAGE